jgi:DNA-binding CsgD family transcriptional regulator
MATVMRTGELAAAFDDADTAELSYRMLLPYRQYFGGQSAAYLGAIPATLSRLATTLNDNGAAVTHATAAIEMERQVGAQPFVALAELALARALIARGQSGDRAQALTLLENSRTTARRLTMAPTVAAATKLSAEITGLEIGAAALTRRERQIAALLAAGMLNREIARELVVSERTIEAHVHNLLPKLGLRNRTQVAAWAVRSRLNGETT